MARVIDRHRKGVVGAERLFEREADGEECPRSVDVVNGKIHVDCHGSNPQEQCRHSGPARRALAQEQERGAYRNRALPSNTQQRGRGAGARQRAATPVQPAPALSVWRTESGRRQRPELDGRWLRGVPNRRVVLPMCHRMGTCYVYWRRS